MKFAIIIICAFLIGCGCGKRAPEPENDRQVLMRLHALLTEKSMGEGGRDLTEAEIADAHVRCKRSPDLADECESIDRLVAKLRAKP